MSQIEMPNTATELWKDALTTGTSLAGPVFRRSERASAGSVLGSGAKPASSSADRRLPSWA